VNDTLSYDNRLTFRYARFVSEVTMHRRSCSVTRATKASTVCRSRLRADPIRLPHLLPEPPSLVCAYKRRMVLRSLPLRSRRWIWV